MFLTFEGTEGCGKSTLIRLLRERFLEHDIPVVSTREPGGVPSAESIRQILIHQSLHPMTELFLFEAARHEHFCEVILPALKAKKWVLCDRFTDSTLAYQGYARGLDLKMIQKLNQLATQGIKPQLTFFLDLPVEEGLARVEDANRFEAEGIAFQKKVRRGFLNLIKLEPRRFRVLKVKNKSPKDVLEMAWKVISP